jgi:hypothetical protein
MYEEYENERNLNNKENYASMDSATDNQINNNSNMN